MVRRTRTQRSWDLVQQCVIGLAIILAGIAIAMGPVSLHVVTIPQSSLFGGLIIVIGILLVSARVLAHRRYLHEQADRRSATSSD